MDPAVLIVDDRPANLLALEAILEPLKLRLIKAASGREALKYLLADDCALILLDVQMPDLDGFETAALIRARERTRYQPIIFVTAVHREESNIIKGYAHGALDYLVKPVDPQMLLAKVRVFIEQYTREQGLHQEAQLRTRERDEMQKRERVARADAEAQREHLHRLFMQAPAAIAILRGSEHVFELANARFEQLVGQSGLVGKRGRRAISGAEAWSILDGVFANDEPFLGNEYPALFGIEGRLFNFAAQPTHGPSGEVTGVMIHAVEVTDSVLARRKTEALAKQLQDTDRSKDEFLAMLGHELRNPLAPILTALHLMRQRSGAEGSEHERAIIERQVRHLSRLVDDLLDVSRATMGKIDLRREPLEISTAVARAVEVSAPLLQAKQQKLTVRVPGLGLLIAGDPVRLAQVIANLLNNAAKYSEERGNIDVYARRDGGEILITVKDDGRGISADRLPTIFELFVQGDQPVDRSQGGLGVGLTLVRSLVALHGGRVEARSDGPGRGSEFLIRLPALNQPAPAKARPALDRRGPNRTLRVLVVDDNADAAEMLSHALRDSGHQVREEHDGLSALVTAADFNPDVVLLDIGLPGMDGFEVARRLRADPRFAKVRIVALTGYGQDTDKKRTAEVGIDRHLVKPVEMEQVIDAIHADEH